jgi:glyoxylase-like metal-dependent hydrolase (beta-lactamase superfamily II)
VAAVTVHHLNCGTLQPAGSFGGRAAPARLVVHCLLVERTDGLTLVDSGFGTADLADPGRLGRPFRALVRPRLDPAETAIAQVKALGYQPEEVTDIVLTHLDLDHVGGIGDFPRARVHVFEDELARAMDPPVRERARYVPAQWAHGPQWVRHRVRGEEWFGFDSVAVLDEDVLMVPLRGHTHGHCGVAVRDRRDTSDGGDRWLLHAGDAYFFHGEKDTPRTCPPGLRVFQSAVQVDGRARHHNQDRLRHLWSEQHADLTVFCAHDAAELEALASG